MMQAPTKLAQVWFGESEKALATTIGSLAGPIGCIVGFLFPLFFLSVGPVEPSQTKEEMRTYIIWQSAYVTFFASPIILLIRNKPPFAPSLSAFSSDQPQNVCRNLKQLISNWNFICLLISYSASFSIYGAVGSVVSPLAMHFGFESDWVSVFGAVFILSGLVGSFAQAILLDKYK